MEEYCDFHTFCLTQLTYDSLAAIRSTFFNITVTVRIYRIIQK